MIRRIRYGKQLTSKYSPYTCDIRTKANSTTIICTVKSTFRNKFVNSTNQNRKRSTIHTEHSLATTTTAFSGYNIGDNHNKTSNSIVSITDKTKIRNHFVYLLIVIFISITFADMVTAGTCWAKRNQNGKCKHPMERNVTKEKCCSNGDDVGFTEKDMNEFEYFFATALGDGMACSSCIESCSTAKCGPQRQCVIRQGQPKCVCAPNCKQNQRHHHSERRQNNALHQQINVKTKRQQFQTSTKSTTTHHIQSPLIKRKKSQLTNHTIDHNNHSTNSHRLRKFQTKHLTATIFNNGSQHYMKTRKINHRRQITNKNNSNSNNNNNHHNNDEWEDEIRSRFHGHDLPYPPDDLQLNVNHQYHRAVCGTDGKTYKTECQLKKRACRQESSSLSVAYKGQCQTSCKHVKCSAGEHCLEDQNLMPHCVTCSITCPPYDPAMKSTIVNPSRLVCGVDGITYRNLCEIKRSACMLGRSIPVAYRGPCQENANCDNIKCKDRQVCLNDLITHRPRCISCSFKCPRRKTPQGQRFIKICGVNNKSYHSWCQMMRDSCNTGYFIDVKHNGICHNAAHNSTMRI